MNGRTTAEKQSNKNDTNRGFYRKNFKQKEVEDLETDPIHSLRHEAEMLRVMIRRVVEKVSCQELDRSLEEDITALNALGIASTRLANLLRIEKTLAAEAANTAESINQTLAEALAEMREENP